MTAQPSMFDALAARDAALERVLDAADPNWVDDAHEIVRWLCSYAPTWTSEDVWKYLRKPREPRALGPILKAAVRNRWCEPMGYVTCSMTSRHAAPVRMYRSLLGALERTAHGAGDLPESASPAPLAEVS